jgi:hypothetical protein
MPAARGRLSTVETTTSIRLPITSPAAFFSGMPTRSTRDPGQFALSVTAMATKAQPAAHRRRSTTARDLESSRMLPSL